MTEVMEGWSMHGSASNVCHKRMYSRNLGSSLRHYDNSKLIVTYSCLQQIIGKSFARDTAFARGRIVSKAEEGADRK